jgi:DeoR/GlpR family transcriptional regulator of sugar metabolism
MRFAGLEEVDVLVTDADADRESLAEIEAAGLEVVLA